MRAGVKHCPVLGGHGDDVVAPGLVYLCNASNRKVVALGGSGGEDDLLRRCSDECSNLLTRGGDGGGAFPSERMAMTGGVAKCVAEVGKHSLKHLRVNGRGGVIIKIYGKLYVRRHRNLRAMIVAFA